MAFVALSLSLAVGCGGDDDDKGSNNGGNNGGGGNDCGAAHTCGWPSNTVLSEFDLVEMPTPTGATNLKYNLQDGYLGVSFNCTEAGDSDIESWFPANGWNLNGDCEDITFDSKCLFRKDGKQVTYTRNGANCSLAIYN